MRAGLNGALGYPGISCPDCGQDMEPPPPGRTYVCQCRKYQVRSAGPATQNVSGNMISGPFVRGNFVEAHSALIIEPAAD